MSEELRPLGEVAAETSPFVKIEVGESFTGKFLGARKVVSPANPVDKQGNPNYVTEAVFDAEGVGEKSLLVGAKLIPLLKDVAIGSKVTITKTGKQGNAYTYEVKKVE